MRKRLNERVAKSFALHRNEGLPRVLSGVDALERLGAQRNERFSQVSRYRIFSRLRCPEADDDDGENVAARFHRHVPVV